jgi:hypothetical protein
MNQYTYTQQFLDLNFAPYKNLVDDILITDDLHTTKIPMFDISLDKDILEKIYNFARKIDHKFNPAPHHTWFKLGWADQPRSHNWHEITIKQAPSWLKHRVAVDEPPVERTAHILGDAELEQLFDQLFAPLGQKITNLRIIKLEANGWIAPHMDVWEREFGLCYFWIPLHEFPPCLKLFPWGWLQHKLGKMYLFNQSSYVHAVRNTTDQTRLVITGRFLPSDVSPLMLEQYLKSKETFRDLFAD